MANSVELRTRFGDRVQALLDKKGLSSVELAARSSLPISRIERILHGRLKSITLRDITIIAAVLETPADALLVPKVPAGDAHRFR